MIADYFTKPLQGNLFMTMRDVITGIIPYTTMERVEDKICSGNERQEIKLSTSDKGDSQASGKGTVLDATQGNS